MPKGLYHLLREIACERALGALPQAVVFGLFFWMSLHGSCLAGAALEGTLWRECWKRPPESGYLGCGAADFVIKSTLCELQGYLDLGPQLKMAPKQKEHFRRVMQRFNLTLIRYQSMNDMVNAKLMEIMTDPQLDLKKVDQALEQLQENCDRIMRSGLRAILKIRKNFTPEQLEIIIGYKPKRRPHRLPVVSCGK
ncbi:hypothetical protein [Thermosulfuriphilus sp.]